MIQKRYPIYLANVFLGFHYYLIIYVNSSFLSQFVSATLLNFLYTAGAILSIVFLLLLPRLFERVGAKTLTLFIIALEFISILGLSLTNKVALVAILFVSGQAFGILILYCLDLFLEASMQDEKTTGWVRALALTILNSTLIVSLLAVAKFAQNSFNTLYLLSAIMLLPLFVLIIWSFDKNIHKNKEISLKEMISFLSANKDVFRILVINFLLQFFYTVMIIYLPFLLLKVGLFSWPEVGKILLIMILPFIIFEAILGKLFDQKTGEREFLMAGIVIMALSTLILSLLKGNDFWIWASILFISRIGASFVEMASESYFFKKVTDRNSAVIGLFRITGPLAYIALPLFSIPILFFSPSLPTLFLALSLLTLFSLLFIPKIDSR